MHVIKLYIHGACSNNPGIGGWSAIYIDESAGIKKDFSGSSPSTTLTQMKLTALLTGLQAIQTPPDCVQIFSDSLYIINSLRHGDVEKWHKLSWRKQNGFPVPDSNLWEGILIEIRRLQTIMKYTFLPTEQTTQSGSISHKDPDMSFCADLAASKRHDLQHELDSANNPQPQKDPAGKGEQYIITMRVSAPEDVTIRDLEHCLNSAKLGTKHLETLGVTRILDDGSDTRRQEEALLTHSIVISRRANEILGAKKRGNY